MNRDEFFKRPTSKSSWCEGIIAGRDQEPGKEGGTWLGMNAEGNIGLLTNIYAGKHQPGAGRGFLVVDFLKSKHTDNYMEVLSKSDIAYSPFNLILFEPKDGQYSAQYYCRGHEECVINESQGPFELKSGCHGVSNHPINQPYRKTQHGLENFEKMINEHMHCSEEILIEKLFNLMSDNQSFHPDQQMIKQAGQRSSMTPHHQKLACINVDISEFGYGTRVTTIILVDQTNNAKFIERDLQSNETTVHSFSLK